MCLFYVRQNTTCRLWERTKSSPEGSNAAFLQNMFLLPKANFLIIVRQIHDETHCSAALSYVVFLMIPQLSQGVNFWTESLMTALTAKYFRTCKGDFLLHPQRLPVCKIHLFPFLKLTLLNMSGLVCRLNTGPFLKMWATTAFYFKCWTNKSHLTWFFCEPECVRSWKACTRISKTILRQN